MRTRVKFCGLTRVEDAAEAVRLGVDAVGLVFYDPSPRSVDIAQAREIVATVPPLVAVVGLFVNAAPAKVRAVLDVVRIDVLQFHGDEPPAACGEFGRPWIKALRMESDTDPAVAIAAYREAGAVLLDTWREGTPGGTGESFDWGRVPREVERPLILAGGLTADNVAAAIRQVRPYAVDVSGGIEAAKGIKDHQKMAAFMREVKRVGTDETETA
ncbi:MAG: phosphoribosylanthranilate isomerase [Pseudomonadota bacterium]|nr:MAG: phosphoribosylanthranilate isomerase [Pseudomonadota bacterium]